MSAARTPIGSFSASLAGVPATKLGTVAIQGALRRGGVEAEHVGEVIMGNVISAGAGQSPARQSSLGAGLPLGADVTTINKVCASGLKSITLAAQSISLGLQDVVVAGGMESMSQVPYYSSTGRGGFKYGHAQLEDGILKDGLWDVYNNIHMGNCAEKTAKDYGITREEQDAYAIESYKRSALASESGLFAAEVEPVAIPQPRGKPDRVFEADEEYTRVNFDRFGSLRPAFQKEGGTVTAGNASTLNDGGAAVVLMSGDRARELGLKPMARVLGYGDAAQAPIDFPTAPSKAVPKAMAMAGLRNSDIDLWEINEAFAVVVLANMKELGVSHDIVNVNGGAISLGHPIGCSGARITVTLAHLLASKGAGAKGCASICNGGGGATALVIEAL